MSEEKKTKLTLELPEAVRLQNELTQVVCKIVASLGLERAVKMLDVQGVTWKSCQKIER